MTTKVQIEKVDIFYRNAAMMCLSLSPVPRQNKHVILKIVVTRIAKINEKINNIHANSFTTEIVPGAVIPFGVQDLNLKQSQGPSRTENNPWGSRWKLKVYIAHVTVAKRENASDRVFDGLVWVFLSHWPGLEGARVSSTNRRAL